MVTARANDANSVATDSSAAWSDAWRGARRVGAALVIPAVIGAVEARSVEKLPWLGSVPVAVLVLACAVGGLVGWRRAARLRVLLAPLGWPLASRVEPRSMVGGTKLFPFDERRRGSGDGAVGLWRGRRAAVFAYGARTLIHCVKLGKPLPSLQLVPVGAGGAFDVGAGRTVDIEVATISKNWRILAPDARFAHAALPPSVLKVLDAIPEPRPIIAIDGTALWTVDRGVRLAGNASVERFTMLAEMADRIPKHLAADFAAAALAATPSAFFGGSNEKNSLARISVVLSFGGAIAPIGILVGILALRAHARGRASNRKVAVVGICLCSAMTAFLAFATYWAFSAGAS